MFIVKKPFIILFCSILLSCFLMMEESFDMVLFLILLTAAFCTVCAAKRLFISKYLLIILAGIIFASISFSFNNSYAEAYNKISGYNIKISGTVASFPEKLNNCRYIEISDCMVSGRKISGKIGLFASDKNEMTASAEAGDFITLTADSISPSTSDDIYRYHTLSDKVFLNAFCYNGSEEIIKNYKNGIYYKICALADKINTKISENMYEEGAAVTKALLTGNKSSLSSEQTLSIKVAGVSHIFAVSGMHLSLWTGIFFLILKNRSRASVIPNLLSLVFVIFYSFLTGLSPSVLRAGIMLSAVFVGRIFRRHSDALNSLGLAGSVLVICNPFLCGNISFLLSTLSTFTLIFITKFLLPSLNTRKKEYLRNFFRKVSKSLLTSLTVIFMCLPLTSVFFGSVSMLSPVYSLILTPVAQLLMSFSAFAVLVPSGMFLSELCFSVCELLSNIINTGIFYARNFEFAVIPVNKNIIIPWFIATFIIMLVFVYVKNSKRLAVSFVLISSIILSGYSAFNTYESRHATEIFIPDSSNSTLIALYNEGEGFIFGCGGEYSDVNTVSSFFNSKGKSFIKAVFIPRESEYDSKNYQNIQKRFNPLITENLSSKIYKCEISESFTIDSESSNNFCAAAFSMNGIKIVICALPSSDFSICEDLYKSGDILITRNKLPKNVKTENFSDIIIMTDNIHTKIPDNAVTTMNGPVTVTLKGENYVID